MTQKIELISNYINTDKIVGIKKVKNLSNYDKLLIAKEVVAIMIDAKQNQIQNEPNESIWKEEQSQLYRVLGLMDCEEESWHGQRGINSIKRRNAFKYSKCRKKYLHSLQK